jgi:TonB family protein
MNHRPNKTDYKPITVALVLALILHAQLIFTNILPMIYNFWSELFPRPERSKITEIKVVPMPSRRWAENQKVIPKLEVTERKKEKQEALAEKEKEKDDKDIKGQEVDVAPTPDSTRPKDAKFLSEHNTNVKKESVSRDQKKDYGIAQSRRTVAEFSRKTEAEDKMKGHEKIALLTKKKGEQAKSQEEKSFAFEIPDIKKRQSLQLKLDLSLGELASYSSSDELKGNSKRLKLQKGEIGKFNPEVGDRGNDQQTVAKFSQPTLDQLDMITGAPANDHIRDVPKGEETLLNSKEFRYATFFNRVKRVVSEQWSPVEVYLQHDPYGNVYGVKDRYTLLNIELDDQGELRDVQVVQSSGMVFLDDEARQAFQSAAPFPNPPRGMLEDDGRIRFQFGFYFEIGERPSIRAFRSNRYPGSRF